MGRLRTIGRKAAHIHLNWVVFGLLFWLAQLVAWICMMMYVQFFPNHLKSSILYTIQISHWALVITCGTAATATLGVLTSRHHSEQSRQQLKSLEVKEDDILRLARMAPGKQADELAKTIIKERQE